MKRNKIFLVLALCLAVFSSANAQQDLMLSQEIFSRVNKNPAATGNTDDIDIFLHGRIQWAGIDNGPQSGVLNVTNYCDKLKSGMGLTMAYDKIGIGHSTTNLKAVYAYHIDLSENYVLSLGLGAGVNWGHFDFYANTLENESEYGMESYQKGEETKVTPDFDLGFELSTSIWTLGGSVTHLTISKSTTFESERHYYLYGTSLIPINPKFDLGPTVAYMHRDKTDVLEVGSLVFYDRILWGGVTWRPDVNRSFNPSVMVFTLGLEWNKFRFGYSYDLGLGSRDHRSSGAHDIILSYGIAKKSNR